MRFWYSLDPPRISDINFGPWLGSGVIIALARFIFRLRLKLRRTSVMIRGNRREAISEDDGAAGADRGAVTHRRASACGAVVAEAHQRLGCTHRPMPAENLTISWTPFRTTALFLTIASVWLAGIPSHSGQGSTASRAALRSDKPLLNCPLGDSVEA